MRSVQTAPMSCCIPPFCVSGLWFINWYWSFRWYSRTMCSRISELDVSLDWFGRRECLSMQAVKRTKKKGFKLLTVTDYHRVVIEYIRLCRAALGVMTHYSYPHFVGHLPQFYIATPLGILTSDATFVYLSTKYSHEPSVCFWWKQFDFGKWLFEFQFSIFLCNGVYFHS